MNFLTHDFGNLYAVFLENELVFGFDSPLLSIKLDCRDFEYVENGIVLYGIEPNGLIRSRNTLSLSEKSSLIAMHDSTAEINALNGSRILFAENRSGYTYTVANGDSFLALSLSGNCRCDEGKIVFRRGTTEIDISEPTAKVGQCRRGFEYEASACLGLLPLLDSRSELLPLLLLVNGLENAVFDEGRAEMINKRIPTMSEQNKKTAEEVLYRYYRAFGIEKR